ncbi:tyrosine-type recombinase/integrase [Streptosporangium sp. NPDC001682]
MDPAKWTPRELRHSFVSLLSDHGTPLEEISRLVGHSSTAVTEAVYLQQIRPALQVEPPRWTASLMVIQKLSHAFSHSEDCEGRSRRSGAAL